jgi:hypothetical protein
LLKDLKKQFNSGPLYCFRQEKSEITFLLSAVGLFEELELGTQLLPWFKYLLALSPIHSYVKPERIWDYEIISPKNSQSGEETGPHQGYKAI